MGLFDGFWEKILEWQEKGKSDWDKTDNRSVDDILDETSRNDRGVQDRRDR